MPFKKGQTGSKKGRSGRRKLSEELIARAAKLNAEEIAGRLINRHLTAMEEDTISDTDELVKIAMPIKLKSMTDNIKTTVQITGYENLKDDELKQEYDRRFNKRRNDTEAEA